MSHNDSVDTADQRPLIVQGWGAGTSCVACVNIALVRSLTLSSLVAAASATLALGACTPPGDDTVAPQTGCAASVDAAAVEAEPDRQVALLDNALVACATASAFTAQLAAHPGIIGFRADVYLEGRCTRSADERVRRTPACSSIVGPDTTPPPTAVEEQLFVGETLDGRTIEIRPSSRIPFEGEVPAVVQQTVDIAVESGCDGVIAQRDKWAAQVDDPFIGDEASVFAQHAQNVAEYIGCEPGDPSSTSLPADDAGNDDG